MAPVSNVELQIEAGEASSRRTYFLSSDCEIEPNAEATLVASLIPCMRRHVDLSIREPVDQRLLTSLPTIQEIYRAWFRVLTPVEIRAEPAPARQPGGSRVALFFSGGVDSLFSLYRHLDEITDLVFVHGFDIRLSHETRRTKASAVFRRAAEQLGKNFIEIETDYGELIRDFASWPQSHGAALATVAHVLPSSFNRVYIASTYDYRSLLPWGSHPLLDPLWSSHRLEIVHDGCEAGRLEKVRAIAQHDLVMKSLRSCWNRDDTNYNCGHCDKCIRTMINLRIAGALDRCETFPNEIDFWSVLRETHVNPSSRPFVIENLHGLSKEKNDPDLLRALRLGFFLGRVRGSVAWLVSRLRAAVNPRR